jgi:hypothetical protein
LWFSRRRNVAYDSAILMSKSRLPIIPKVVVYPQAEHPSAVEAPPPIEARLAVKMENLLRQYSTVVDASDLASSSKSMYIDFATCFVRWMNGAFEPGKFGPRYRSDKPFQPGVENSRK